MTTTAKKHPYAQWAPDARALDIVGDKWTLLIVRDLLAGPLRFVELQRALPGISTEQLRSRLNVMREAGLLTKERFREVPPRVDYELTPQAFDLVPVIAALARWGWTHAAGEPQQGEKQDPRALFRMLPALALDTGLTLSDEVALAVRGTGDYYVAGPAENEDAPSPVAVRRVVGDFEATPVAVSQIVGDEDAWIDAVTNAVFDGLRIIGFDTVIDGVLRTLAGQPVGLSFAGDYEREAAA